MSYSAGEKLSAQRASVMAIGVSFAAGATGPSERRGMRRRRPAAAASMAALKAAKAELVIAIEKLAASAKWLLRGGIEKARS